MRTPPAAARPVRVQFTPPTVVVVSVAETYDFVVDMPRAGRAWIEVRRVTSERIRQCR